VLLPSLLLLKFLLGSISPRRIDATSTQMQILDKKARKTAERGLNLSKMAMVLGIADGFQPSTL
jgi:hypothetical protein